MFLITSDTVVFADAAIELLADLESNRQCHYNDDELLDLPDTNGDVIPPAEEIDLSVTPLITADNELLCTSGEQKRHKRKNEDSTEYENDRRGGKVYCEGR